MNDNSIPTFEPSLSNISTLKLKTIYLERNPLQEDSQYQNKITRALPTLEQVDALMILRRPGLTGPKV